MFNNRIWMALIFLLFPLHLRAQVVNNPCPLPSVPFRPLTTQNPQNQNLQANACFDPNTGILTWQGPSFASAASLGGKSFFVASSCPPQDLNVICFIIKNDGQVNFGCSWSNNSPT